MAQDNPFEAPGEAHPQARDREAEAKRPLPPKVIGVIAVVMACLGVVGSIVNLAMPAVLEMQNAQLERIGFDLEVMRLMHILGLGMACFLFVTGIGLVRYRNWGRVAFNVYAGVSIASQLASNGYTVTAILGADLSGPERWGAIGGLIGGLVGALFALVLLIVAVVLLNKQRVKASLT